MAVSAARVRAPSTPNLGKALSTVLGIGAALAVVIWLAWHSGGLFAPDVDAAGAAVFAVVGVLILLRAGRFDVSVHALLGVATLAALTAWTGLSAIWSSDPPAALEAMQRSLLYTGLFVLGLLAVGSGRHARAVVAAILVAAVGMTAAGLLSRLMPDLITTRSDSIAEYRLGYPFGYWNAFGALAAMAAVLALGVSADPRSPVAVRAGSAGASVLCAVAMYLSFSRGAWLATVLGLLVLVALGAHRGSLLWALAIVGGATTLALVRLDAYPALTDNPARGSGQLAQGHAYAGQLVVAVAAAVVAMGLVAAGRASPNLMRASRRVLRPVALVVAAALVLVAFAAYVVRADAVEGRTTAALNDSSAWVNRQWRDFLRPAAFSETGTARLTSARGTRSDLFRVAFDGFEGRPLLGEGAGSYPVRWVRKRRVNETVIFAHSLFFETVGDLGIVGGILLIGFLATLVVATVRSRLRPAALPRAKAAAVGAACAVWMGHAMVDWDWQMPGLTGLALLLAATLYPVGRGRRRASPGRTAAD